MKHLWYVWTKALGDKAHEDDAVSDQVAFIRTFIFLQCLITNAFIIAGIIRHWNH